MRWILSIVFFMLVVLAGIVYRDWTRSPDVHKQIEVELRMTEDCYRETGLKVESAVKCSEYMTKGVIK
jgi:hypothetical protein